MEKNNKEKSRDKEVRMLASDVSKVTPTDSIMIWIKQFSFAGVVRAEIKQTILESCL